ncbi:MAG: glycosyltransferase family 2 protein [Flavobacteriales bacterium]|nr:glycosyltransferase family 2 protein [Flavobacteriales bacterium]
MKTAVVVLNWNGKAWLEKFLPNLVNHSQEATVFIADNASTDDSVAFVKSHFPTVKIIINASNGGYARGYNDALKQISADYFVLINSDIQVTENWLSPIINLMDSDDKIAACQPKLLDYNKRTKFEYAGASGGFIDNLGYPFCRGRIFNELEEDKGQYNDTTEVFWATGACFFVRAKCFWEVGGFDNDFFAHQEEIDLCWRLKNIDYKIMVEPKSMVYHVGGGTLNTGSAFKTHLNFRNNLKMLFKNLHLSSLFVIIPIRLVLDAVAAITFLKQTNGFFHLLAIAKAHFAFYFAIPKLMAKRQNIKQKRKLVGKVNWSILFKNKIKGMKRFTEL